MKKLTISAVIEQIKQDIENGDITAIEVLLKSTPSTNLVSYMPDSYFESESGPSPTT